MPTIHRQEGFRFIIYPDDHAPAHVHVYHSGTEVKIDITSDPPVVIKVFEMSKKDVKVALAIVAENRIEFLEKWVEWTN